MTAPDLRAAGLDPAHILGICALATSAAPGQPLLAVSARDSVCVCLRSRRAARDAFAALARVGYQVTPPGGGRAGRDLLITGWSASGLETRLTAMRGVVLQLDRSPTLTARAVIEQVRGMPRGVPSASAGPQILDQARARLRAWVSARSGLHAPHNPAIVPPDLGNAMRLRAARLLETVIDDLIERHLQVATHALPLFGSLRQSASADYAQQAAIRHASITFNLSGPSAEQTIAPVRSAVRPKREGPSPAWPDLAGYVRAAPADRPTATLPRAAASSITAPGTAWTAGTASDSRARPDRTELPRQPSEVPPASARQPQEIRGYGADHPTSPSPVRASRDRAVKVSSRTPGKRGSRR